MISSDFVGHVLLQGFSPSEITNFDPQIGIQKDVQALKISMQDGRRALMEIEYSLGNLYSQPSPLFPSYIVVFVLQVRPKRSTLAILQYETIMRVRGYSPKKHNNIRMPHSLHRMALAQEIPQTHIPILYLELLHNHRYLSPSSPIDHSVPSLIDLRL